MNDYRFGNFVCMLREKKGLTQAEVARRLGVTPAAVSKWENGSSKPRVEVLFQLAEILDVKPEELMSGHYIAEDFLNPDSVAKINERYEYLRKIDARSATGAKVRRVLAWLLDWYLCGFSTMIALAIYMAIFANSLGNTAILGALFLIICFPVCFVLRDLIMGGRSLGKRIFGLMVLDQQTGQIAKPTQRLVRNLFFFLQQIDGILLLCTGSSVGDRVAHTAVIQKKDFADTPPVSELSTTQRINSYQPPSLNKKHIILILVAVFLVLAIFVGCLIGFIFSTLSQVEQTEEYKIAHLYLLESEYFEQLGADVEDVRFSSYNLHTTLKNGSPYKTATLEFRIAGKGHITVVCHQENGEWSVCRECTDFE